LLKDKRFDNPKAASIARRNSEYSRNGSPQYIGRPAGPKAKGHKTPATGILPYVRFSVIPNGNATPTPGNAARAKDLASARRKAIRAAKNSVD